MALAAAFAVLNAVVAWVMFGGFIAGPPPQVRRRAFEAFWIVNSIAGLVIAYAAWLSWIRRVHWFKKTGDAIPFPRPEKASLRQFLTALPRVLAIACWFLLAIGLTQWLTPILWPIQSANKWLFSAVAIGPIFAYLFVRLRADWRKQPALIRLAVFIRDSSAVERTLLASCALWPFAVAAYLDTHPRWAAAPSSLPIMVLALCGGWVFLGTCLAFSTHRR
jgi:hypothetical protein